MSQPKVDWSQYELRTEESAAPATPATDWSQFELRQDEPPAPIEDQVSRTATRVERQGPVNDDQVAREQRRIAREQRIAARKAPTSEGFDPSIAGDQLMSGVTAMQQGFFTNNAKLASSQLNVFDRIDRGEQVQDTDDPVGYAHMDPEQRKVARASMQQSLRRNVVTAAGYSREKGSYERNANAEEFIALADKGEYKSAWKKFASDPIGIVQQLSVESTPNMLPSLAAGGAGLLLKGGVGGFMAGLAGGSYPVEYISSIVDSLADAKVDLEDVEAVERKLRDPKFLEAAGKRADTRGKVIASMDAAGGRFAFPLKKGAGVLKNTGRAVGAGVAETVTEGAGEAGAMAASGEEIKMGQVFAEMLGAGPQAVATTTMRTVAEARELAKYADPVPDAVTPPPASPTNTPSTPSSAATAATAPTEAPVPAEEVLGRVEPPVASAPAATPSVPTEAPIAAPGSIPAAETTVPPAPAPEIDTSAMDEQGKAAVKIVKDAHALSADLDTLTTAGIDVADWLGQGDVLGREFDPDTVQTVQMLAEVARDPAKLAQLQKLIGGINEDTQGAQPAAPVAEAAPLEGAAAPAAGVADERGPGAAQADQGSDREDSGVKPQRELDHTQRVEQARTQANTEPTDAQKEAGNYAKGHLSLHGFNLSIENPKGSTRTGTSKKGKKWSSKLRHDYGYIRGTVGKDKDHLDIFIGKKPDSKSVWVIDQKNPDTGVFDEHKIILGATSEEDARAIYAANYPKGWKGLQRITATDVDMLKGWIASGKTTKPFSPYAAEHKLTPTDRGINVEVAPNPDNTQLTERFNALPEQEKRRVTQRVGDRVIPKVLADLGIEARIEHTVGGFEGSTNPSILLHFDAATPFEKMTEAAKALGHVFSQKAVIVFDENDTKGGNQVGHVIVNADHDLSYEQQHDIFAAVTKAFPAAAGFTGNGGVMVFGNYTGFSDNPLTDEQFHQKLDEALAGLQFDFTSERRTWRSEYDDSQSLEGTRYGQGDTSSDGDAQGSGRGQRGDLDTLRQESDQALAAALEAPRFNKRQAQVNTGVRLTPGERGSSVEGILNGNEKLPEGKQNVLDVGNYLQARTLAASGEKLRPEKPKKGQPEAPNSDASIARILAHDVLLALRRVGHGAGWYKQKIEGAIRVAGLVYPEIAADPQQRFMFTVALAITSNGQTIGKNVDMAFYMYDEFRRTGKFPEDFEMGGARADQMRSSFAKVNTLIAENDIETAMHFLTSKAPAKWLKDMGHSVSELMTEEVYGGTILGSKVGGAFLQNLNGNFDALTMDRWFMRTWGRIVGRLTHTGTEREAEARNDFIQVMKDRRIQGDPLEVAKQKYGEASKRSFENMTTVEKAARRYLSASGMRDSPASGGDRSWMRKVVAKALELVNSQGHKLDIADLQAVLWYVEKEAYGKFGATDEEATPTDYEQEVAKYAAQFGVDAKQIERAIRGGRRGEDDASAEPQAGAGREGTLRHNKGPQPAGVGAGQDGSGLQRRAQEALIPPVGENTPTFNSRPIQDDAVTVVGIHYSATPDLAALDGDQFDKRGFRSEESERVAFAKDLSKRVYFYAQLGPKLPTKETVLPGRAVYRVKLTNLLDLDSANGVRILTEGNKAGRATDHNGNPVFKREVAENAIERAIIAAGYDGFFLQPSKADPRGGIVVLGVDQVPVEHLGTMAEAAPKVRFNKGPALAEMDAPPAPGKYEEDGAIEKYERAAWVLAQLGTKEDFFNLPKTDSKDIKEIAKAFDPRITVESGVKSAPDMRAVWEISLPPTEDGKSGGTAMVRVYKNGRIEANFASLIEGRGRGAMAYQMVAEYARNNELRFIGDPDGLRGLDNPNEKGVAHVRRAEHMVSTFIKSGTTEHMEPHELQILDGFMDDPDALDVTKALKRWRGLDGLTKTAYAIRYAHGKIAASIPAIADLRYDFERNYFYDIFDKDTALSAEVFDELAKHPAVRRAGGGSRSIRRAAIVNSVLSADDADLWAARVAGVRAGLDGVLPGALRKLAYNEAAQAGASFPASDARRLINGVLKRWGNGPKVVLHESVADANAALEAMGFDTTVAANRVDDTSKGFFANGEVHIVLPNFSSQRDVLTTLAHEAVGHYGVRAILGETEFARISAEITKLRKLGNKQIEALYQSVLATHGELSPEEMADEIIARAAEAAIDADGNVRPGFGWFKRILAQVAAWLRAHGMDVPFTHAELQGILRASAANLERGRAAVGADGMAFNRAPQTETPAFKAWFGDSKVVDESGDPLRVYTGTSKDTDFKSFRAPQNGIWFTSDPSSASQYAVENDSRGLKFDGRSYTEVNTAARVMPVYLSLKNPKVYSTWPDSVRLATNYKRAQGLLWQQLRLQGHDGVIGPDGIYVVFEPTQIKSAVGNDGQFDPKKPSILQNRGLKRWAPQHGEAWDTSKVGMLDAALRYPGKYVSRYVLQPVASRVSSLVDRVTPEKVKHGAASDYGLPEPYLDAKMDRAARTNQLLRNTNNLMNQIKDLDRQQARIAYLWMADQPDLDAESRIMDQLPEASRKTLVEMKKAVSAIGQEAVDLGLMDQETYDRNNLAYLRRSYKKHESLMSEGQKAARRRAITIKGDQFKARGLRHDMEIGDTVKGDKYIRYEKRDDPKDGERLGKLTAIEYIPIGNKVPKRLESWRYDGVWEARFFDKEGQVGMWRDFTLEERQYMGEIDEVRFAFGTSMLRMVRDVENARFLRWVTTEYSKADEAAVEAAGGVVVEGTDKRGSVQSFSNDEWVQVPMTSIPGTGLRKYGDLAGRYITGAMFNDIRQIANSRDESGLWGAWDKMMRVWKISKTALSPAVHMNNVMSNFIMADLADVRGRDLARAMLMLRKAAKGDEDAKRMVERFEDSGGDLGNFAAHELGQEIEKVLMKELGELDTDASDSVSSLMRAAQVVDLMLHGKAREAISQMMLTKPMRALKWPFAKLIEVYGQEDTVFRFAKFLKELEEGKTDRAAGKGARDAFLNYEINAPWINALRRVPFPFLAYSYRAIPMLLKAAVDKPWKFAKYAMVGGAFNAMAYSMLGLGGDDEDDERKLLPEELTGRTLGIFPRLMRMPWNDAHGSPIFLDLRRWIPAGDIFSLQPHAALPIPSWLTIGGPLTMVMESVTNRSVFTGKDIVNDSDTTTEKIAKYLDYQMKFWSPNLPIPNPLGFVGEQIEGFPVGWLQTYSAGNLMRAGKGMTDSLGREKEVAYEAANAVGIKLRPYAKDQLRNNLEYKLRHDLQEIDKAAADLRRQLQRGGLDDAQFNKKIQFQQDKKLDRLQEHREKLGL
jgi:hypothetical protein